MSTIRSQPQLNETWGDLMPFPWPWASHFWCPLAWARKDIQEVYLSLQQMVPPWVTIPCTSHQPEDGTPFPLHLFYFLWNQKCEGCHDVEKLWCMGISRTSCHKCCPRTLWMDLGCNWTLSGLVGLLVWSHLLFLILPKFSWTSVEQYIWCDSSKSTI